MTALVSSLVSSLESFLLSYLLNAIWQVPLLFAAGWAAARALRNLGAAAEHRVWVGTLLLQTLVPACSTIPWDAIRTLLLWAAPRGQDAQPHVALVMGAGTAFGGLHLPASLLAAIDPDLFADTSGNSPRPLDRVMEIPRILSSTTPSQLSNDC